MILALVALAGIAALILWRRADKRRWKLRLSAAADREAAWRAK